MRVESRKPGVLAGLSLPTQVLRYAEAFKF